MRLARSPMICSANLTSHGGPEGWGAGQGEVFQAEMFGDN